MTDFQLFLERNLLKKKDVAEYLGVSNAFITQLAKGDRGIPNDKLAEIKQNKQWDTSMLKSPSESERTLSDVSAVNEDIDDAYFTYILPISAQGGSLNDYTISVLKSECERMYTPIRGADFVIPISGDSMSPDYPNGSHVVVKRINERAFLEWGRVYVLDTCNGSVIKKLMPTDDPNIVRCVSINPEYPPFDVSLDDVHGVYRVYLCMSQR